MYERLKKNAPKPKRTVNRPFRFASTQEWEMMRADLERGVASGQITLTDSDKEAYRIKNRKTVWRFVKMFVAEHNLPYEVTSWRSEDLDYIRVDRIEKAAKKTA